MGDELTAEQVVLLLRALGRDLSAAKDHYNELDSAAGDGDLGISLQRGFEAVNKGLPEAPVDIGQTLAQAGLAFGEAAASTIGALLNTALLRAGKVAQGRQTVGLGEVAAMARAAGEGIRQRGKAELGKKTLLDALMPAVEALEQGAAEGVSLLEGLESATAAAAAGVEATKAMTPAFCRARWLAERSLGHEDPGAVAIHHMLQSATTFVRGLQEKGN